MAGAASFAGPAIQGIGNNIGSFFGSDDYDVRSLVKNPEFDTRIRGLTGEWDTLGDQNRKDLGTWTANYYREEPKQTAQEMDVINAWFDDRARKAQAALRANKAAAMRLAGDRALAYATRDRNVGNLLAGTGGPSSYNTRLGLRAAGDIESQIALDNANQERADWADLQAKRLGLIGTRTNMLQRSLLPMTVRTADLQSRLGLLGGLQTMDAANKFYGIEKDRNTWDKVGEGVSTLGQILSIGGLGGGSPGAEQAAANVPSWQTSQMAREAGFTNGPGYYGGGGGSAGSIFNRTWSA